MNTKTSTAAAILALAIGLTTIGSAGPAAAWPTRTQKSNFGTGVTLGAVYLGLSNPYSAGLLTGLKYALWPTTAYSN